MFVRPTWHKFELLLKFRSIKYSTDSNAKNEAGLNQLQLKQVVSTPP